jgi:hypothetical protein
MKPHEVIVLGPAWAANSVNCVPFRVSGLLSRRGVRHCAYFDAAGDVVIASVETGSGRVVRRVLRSLEKPYDAHRSISLGLDCEGHLHLAFGAHDSPLWHTRAHGPAIDSGFAEPRLLRNTGGRATYPMFLAPAGERRLILAYRDGHAAEGELCVARFDPLTGLWHDDPMPIISGRGHLPAGPYVNTPVLGPNGRIVLFVVWRLRDAADPLAVRNEGIDCVVSRDGLRTLETIGGAPLCLPVKPRSAAHIQEIRPGSSLINQACAAIRADGAPMMATYWDDGDGIPQYRLLWLDAGVWRVATASRFTTRFNLHGPGTLPLPHSRPEIAIGRTGRVYIIFRSREFDGRLMLLCLDPPDYPLAQAGLHVLVDEDLGYYEPVLDRSPGMGGRLALYVQRCSQRFDGDRIPEQDEAEARLMTWHEEQFGPE